MKLSVLANLYHNKTLEETLQALTALGVHTVELGAGGYPGTAQCNPAELLADESLPKSLKELKINGNDLANLGISGNTNACIEMASGNYIALFDHDDLLHQSAL